MRRVGAAATLLAALCASSATAVNRRSDEAQPVLSEAHEMMLTDVLKSRRRESDTCLSLPFSVCTGRGGSIQGPDAHPAGLIAHWSFDDNDGHDETGNRHDLIPAPAVGPARWGVGQSAHFNGTTLAVTDFSDAHQGNEMSLSFWMYLLQDSIGSWRTVIRKGNTEHLTPTVQLWPKERRLHARVTTESGEVEGIDSVAIVPLRRWTHVAFTIQGKLLQLYVNGIFDSQVVLRRTASFNRQPLYLGRDPWHPGTAAYLDSVSVFSRAIDDVEIRAMAQGALGPLSPSDVRLGCLACKLGDAAGACPSSYHLCSEKELFGGAYTVARAQGWFRMSNKVWAEENTHRTQLEQTSQDTLAETRLALCCGAGNSM